MALRNPTEESEYTETLGMDTTSNEAVIPPGYVRDAWNSDIGLEGGYVKRGGITALLDSAWTGMSVLAGIEYKGVSGTRQEIVFGSDGSASGGAIGQVSAGAVSPILSSLVGTSRGSFVQLGKLLGYFSAGDAPVIYNGTTTRQFGITAPAAAPSGSSQTTGGSLTLLSSYVWAYTYYNSVTGAESSPSPVLQVTLTGGNNRVDFTVTAGSSSTADTIRIWRTVASGNELFLEQSVAISATAISSTIADSALSNVRLEEDNSRVTLFVPSTNPQQAQFPCVAQNRLFLKTDKEVVRYSKIGQSGSMFESFEVSAFSQCRSPKGEGDEIVGIGKAGEVPIILKESSIGRLDAVGVPAEFGSDPVRYLYNEISPEIGAVSHHSQVSVSGELVFLGKDNVYATDGRSVRPVGDRISATVKAAGFTATQISKLSSINDTEKSRVIFSFYSSQTATLPDYQLVGDYRKYPNFRWTIYRPGVNSTTHPGLRPGCLYTVRASDTGKNVVRMGNSQNNGQIYRMADTARSDLGLGIYWRVKTRAYNNGAPAHVKLFKDALVQARGDGNNYALTVSAIYDFSGAEEDSQELSLFSGAALWDTAQWDVDSWADDNMKLLFYQPHRKARFQQLVFTQASADQPVELPGWSNSASIFGLS